MAAAPSQVELVFNERLSEPSTVIVTGPGGERVDQGLVRLQGAKATIEITLQLAGRHQVSFRMLSADGHPVAGRTTFSYEPSSPSRPASISPSGDASDLTGQQSTRDDGDSNWVAGGMAVAALAGGAALLAVRRPSDRSGEHE